MPKRKYKWDFDNPAEIKEHSLAKHRVLESYLRHYIRTITSNYNIRNLNLYIVDGFAGGGIYRRRDNKEIHFGSPVIIYETLNRVSDEINKNRTNKIDIKYKLYFAEKDKNAFQTLKKTLAYKGVVSKEPNCIVECFNKSFSDIAEPICNDLLKSSVNSRVIFFLDQYGWSEVSMLQIQRILSILPNAEILLTLASDWFLDYRDFRSRMV